MGEWAPVLVWSIGALEYWRGWENYEVLRWFPLVWVGSMHVHAVLSMCPICLVEARTGRVLGRELLTPCLAVETQRKIA